MRYREAVKWSIAAFFLIALIYFGDIRSIAETVGSTDITIYSAALILFLSTYIPSAERWRTITGSLGYNIGFMNSLKVMSIAYGFNKVVPGNAGDLGRSQIMKQLETVENHFEVLGGVALERASDLVVVISLVLISGSIAGSGYIGNISLIVLPATGIVLLLISGLLMKRETLDRVLDLMPDRWRDTLEQLADGYRSMTPGELGRVFILSIMKWGVEGIVFYILALSLGMETGIWLAILVTSTMSLIAAFPITPAGLGPVDTVAVGMLVIAGFGTSASISLVLLQRSLGFVLMGLLGFLTYSAVIHSSSSRSSS